MFPQHIAETRKINDTCTHAIYESSALSPFQFNNKTVKKIDKYMLQKRNQLVIGYNFSKQLCEANKKDLTILPLPIVVENELMIKTKKK